MNINKMTPEQIDEFENSNVEYSNIEIKNGSAYTDVQLNDELVSLDNIQVNVSFFTEKCKELCPEKQYQKILDFEKEYSSGTLSKIIKIINEYNLYVRRANEFNKENGFEPLSIFTEDRRYVGKIESAE